jgi:DNA-binding response OmpR family regulator
MPVLDGAGVIAALAAQGSAIPVAVLSGNLAEVPSALPPFVRARIAKPCRMADLAARLSALISSGGGGSP